MVLVQPTGCVQSHARLNEGMNEEFMFILVRDTPLCALCAAIVRLHWPRVTCLPCDSMLKSDLKFKLRAPCSQEQAQPITDWQWLQLPSRVNYNDKHKRLPGPKELMGLNSVL